MKNTLLSMEKNNYFSSNSISFENLSTMFRSLNWRFVEGKLWIGDTLQVSEWEKPIQYKAAKLLADLQYTNVLDIGFGLGMFSDAYISLIQTERYVILEAHPEIAQLAIQRYKKNNSVHVICDFWEDYSIKRDEPKYDAIYFDAYLPLDNNSCRSPLYLEQVKSALMRGIPVVSRVLHSEGVLSFLDLTCQLKFSSSEIQSLGFKSFDVFKEQVNIPIDCSYANGKTINIIQMRKL